MKALQDYTPQTSQRELAAEVLKQAAQDLQRFKGATSAVERELYLDAYSWLTSDDSAWPFSFLNVCKLLNLVPEIIRDELRDDFPSGFFNYLIRRYRGVARKFPSSPNRAFKNGHNGSAAKHITLAPALH